MTSEPHSEPIDLPWTVEGREGDGTAFLRVFPTVYEAFREAERVIAGGGWAEITPPPIH